MRLDRLLTLGVFQRLGRLSVGTARRRLAVLMYHSICVDRDARPPYFQTVTHPAAFAEQMRVLSASGSVGVTLSEGLEFLNRARTHAAHPPPVVITFDDGFRDFLTHAVPVLRRHGFKATMYLPTGFIGHLRRTFMERECLTWEEVKGLHLEGFEFGSHTVSHPRLVDLDWTGIRTELAESKGRIEEELGAPVTCFAYPYAFPQQDRSFVEHFGRVLEQTGYSTCVTTMIGRVQAQDDRFHLKRLPVNSCDDARLLQAKLGGAYDWMGSAQAMLKRLKGFARMAG
jgi:peptidoglycan/xylan/chitin deacetylase (PgdA/CDA1 family)